MVEHSLNSLRAIDGPSVFELLIDGGNGLPAFWRGMTNAQALSWLRRRLGLTQVELARMSGVAQSRISRIESGGDALLSTWMTLYAAMGLDLKLLPTSKDISAELRAARKRFRERNYQQTPRLRRQKTDTRPPPAR